MTLSGSSLSLPLRADERGTLAVINRPEEIVAQELLSLILTRLLERKMMPDIGIDDPVFEDLDEGFVARLAYNLEQQAKVNIPGLGRIVKFIVDASGAASHQATVKIQFTLSGSNTPYNMVHPLWRLNPALIGSQ